MGFIDISFIISDFINITIRQVFFIIYDDALHTDGSLILTPTFKEKTFLESSLDQNRKHDETY